MKRYTIFALLLLFVATGCKKSDHDIVEKFVREVKADSYEGLQEVPAFGRQHIDALLQHADDRQLVSRYPWSPILSYYPGQQEVGLVMLYAIEVIRDPGDYPVRGTLVVDTEDRERKVALDEVLSLYRAWWAANKGKSAAELRGVSPLQGTGLAWYGTEPRPEQQ